MKTSKQKKKESRRRLVMNIIKNIAIGCVVTGVVFYLFVFITAWI